MTMAQVEPQFGPPASKLSPAGGDAPTHPVINRWSYGRFTVYFERDRVIDSVVTRASATEIGPKEPQPADDATHVSPACGMGTAGGRSARLAACQTDWAARLADVESTYVALVAAIARLNRCWSALPMPSVRARAAALLDAPRSTSTVPFCRNRIRRYLAARFRSDHPDRFEDSA